MIFFFPFSMTKTDMVDAIAKSAGLTKKAAGAALEALLDAITKDLKKGNNVVITGFGTFRVSKRNARTGVNPQNPSPEDQDPGDEGRGLQGGEGAEGGGALIAPAYSK